MASLLWLEGVDFTEHLFDTNDISIIRGGSLALLHAGATACNWLKAQPGLSGTALVFTGASLALLRLPCDEAAARGHARSLLAHLAGIGLEFDRKDKDKQAPPFAHLRFVAGVAEDDGSALAVRKAQAAARLAQMTGDYPARVITPAAQMCSFTRRLPADTTMTLNASQVERLSLVTDARNVNTLAVSRSAKARRLYGRRARESVFTGLMKLAQVEGRRFTNDLQEMVKLPNEQKGKLPKSVQSKLAYFYADGNGFTAIRNAMGGGADAIGTFSAKVKALIEEDVFSGVLNELIGRAGARDASLRASAVIEAEDDYREADEPADPQQQRLRFELLLYGGDEICFAVPAWLGLDVARLFFEAIKGATIAHGGKSHDLHFKAGLIFVPAKMPVASARHLVKDLAEEARLETGSSLGIHAFESIEPPANGLSGYRRAIFGDPDADDGGKAAAALAKQVLALPAEEALWIIDNLVRMKSAGFPRSQLYRALNIAQWQPDKDTKGKGPRHWPAGLGTAGANRRARDAVGDYIKKDSSPESWADFAEALLSDDADAAIMAWLLTHLWDYADPFGFAQSSDAVTCTEAA